MTQTTPPAASPAPASTNTMAILSLVAGIAGISVVPFIGSIVAVILGPMAKRDIAASGGAQGGEGLATAGTILGWVGIALGLCFGCFMLLSFLLPLVGLGIWGIESSSTSLLSLALFA